MDAAKNTSERRRTGRDLVVWSLLALGMVAVVGMGLWRSIRRDAGHPPVPILAQLPDFELVDQNGRPFGLRDLGGAPWIADFIFTRCTASCPVMSERMRRLGERLGKGSPVRRVSISVDPRHDTPEVLAAYAERFKADAGWRFLTGERDKVFALSISGFKLGVDDAPEQASPEEPILHSTRFVLVDGRGHVRGYYDGFDDAAIEHLLRDVRTVLGENPS